MNRGNDPSLTGTKRESLACACDAVTGDGPERLTVAFPLPRTRNRRSSKGWTAAVTVIDPRGAGGPRASGGDGERT